MNREEWLTERVVPVGLYLGRGDRIGDDIAVQVGEIECCPQRRREFEEQTQSRLVYCELQDQTEEVAAVTEGPGGIGRQIGRHQDGFADIEAIFERRAFIHQALLQHLYDRSAHAVTEDRPWFDIHLFQPGQDLHDSRDIVV